MNLSVCAFSGIGRLIMAGALPPSACAIAHGTVAGIHGGSDSRYGHRTAGNARLNCAATTVDIWCARYGLSQRQRTVRSRDRGPWARSIVGGRARNRSISGRAMLPFPLDSDTTSEAQEPWDGSAMTAKLCKAK